MRLKLLTLLVDFLDFFTPIAVTITYFTVTEKRALKEPMLSCAMGRFTVRLLIFVFVGFFCL